MKLPVPLLEARFLRRLNRFAALVRWHNREVMAHVPNSGRLRELLEPDRRLLLARARGEHRKTRFDLALVALGTTLVSVDARLPNALVADALAQGRLKPFVEYSGIRREVTFGESRLDLLLEGLPGRCYLETKSVTLVAAEGVARFPDAPTSRGVKHLNTLMQVAGQGHRAAVIFVVQRGDAGSFTPHDEADPAFGKALRRALAAGVEIYAYGCRVSPAEIALSGRLPVTL